MSEVSRSPWTSDEVVRLNAWQRNGAFHPFTCPNRGDGNHRLTTDVGCLVATNSGWICPDCEYKQDWAHRFMLEAWL